MRAMQPLNATVIEVKQRVLLILQRLPPCRAVVPDDYSVGSGTENDVSFEHLHGATRQQQLAILQEVLEPIWLFRLSTEKHGRFMNS
jgi:hypothetical protein